MSYGVALDKAWEGLLKLNPPKALSVKFLAQDYTVDTEAREVLAVPGNTAAKDFLVILALHYLAQKLKGLPQITGEWLPFRELAGVEGYAAAFRKRSIEPIIKKYGNNPQELLGALDRLPGKKVNQGDVGIVLEAFEGVPVLISLWRADEEFGPDANLLFDKSVKDIFCTEDIVVLAGMVAGKL